MREPVLVILAAGMGSRYGGLKQIDPIGDHGEKIIDYSLYDAAKAGFKKAVFVIKEELLSAFQETVFPNVERFMEVNYVFQKMEDIPAGFSVPAERVKPWGTSHATLVAARVLGGAPYAVINSDDFYGREAFQKIYDFLKNAGSGTDCAMVGYYLKNTVTEHGTVSRGVCEVTDGKLTGIVERLKIGKRESGIAYTEDEGQTWTPLADDTVVSMNLFGFPAGFTAILEREFLRFFENDVQKNPVKAEFLLPFTVGSMIDGKEGTVTVLSSADKWYGVTYKEDKEQVMAGIRSLTEQGIYPSPLWE